jgi:hypothetical protein
MMALRDEAQIAAGRIATVGDARDFLLSAQRTLNSAISQLGGQADTWIFTSGQAGALTSLIDNNRDYLESVYESLDPYDDIDPINAHDRDRVGLGVAQAADTVQQVADTLAQPGFAQSFIADLGSSFRVVTRWAGDTTAEIVEGAKDVIGPALPALWPVWLPVAVAVGVAAWILYLNRKMLARVAEKALGVHLGVAG